MYRNFSQFKYSFYNVVFKLFQFGLQASGNTTISTDTKVRVRNSYG